MPRYQYEGTEPQQLPTLHREVEPGEVLELDQEINHPHFRRLDDPPAADVGDAQPADQVDEGTRDQRGGRGRRGGEN